MLQADRASRSFELHKTEEASNKTMNIIALPACCAESIQLPSLSHSPFADHRTGATFGHCMFKLGEFNHEKTWDVGHQIR